MTTTKPKPKETSITEAQARLARLAEEEASIEGQLESKELELADAEERGDWQRAAALATEINYLKGQGNHSQRERIQRDRQAAQRVLWDALASELENQAADLETKVSAQKAKEDNVLAHLEEVSGCAWAPKQTTVESLGRPVRHIARPLSLIGENEAKHRRQLAQRLRGADPAETRPRLQAETQSLVRDALKLIPSPENTE
jgi:hypothetical protein